MGPEADRLYVEYYFGLHSEMSVCSVAYFLGPTASGYLGDTVTAFPYSGSRT